MSMWDRIKGKVDHASAHLKPRGGDKDIDENDTAIARALVRFYEPTGERPAWLADVPEQTSHHSPLPALKTPIQQTLHQTIQHNPIHFPGSTNSSPPGSPRGTSTTSLHDILGRRPGSPATSGPSAGNSPVGSPGASPVMSPGGGRGRPGTGRSGLASKLKKTTW